MIYVIMYLIVGVILSMTSQDVIDYFVDNLDLDESFRNNNTFGWVWVLFWIVYLPGIMGAAFVRHYLNTEKKKNNSDTAEE